VKRNSRIILVVFLIGLSLLIVTVMRTNSAPVHVSFGNEEEGATSGWIMYPDFLMFPRDFRVDIRANNTVDVYILDEVAVKQWNASKGLDAAWTYEDVRQGVFSEYAANRGGYAVLVYLPADNVTAIKVTLTFSGFEKDLFAASLAIIAVSVIALSVSSLITRRTKSAQKKLLSCIKREGKLVSFFLTSDHKGRNE
jgi:hypothetical protein